MSLIPSPPPTPQVGLVPSITVFKLLVAVAGALGMSSIAFAQMSFTGTCENTLKDANSASASIIFFIGNGSGLKKKRYEKM
jgi:hypothetical protein